MSNIPINPNQPPTNVNLAEPTNLVNNLQANDLPEELANPRPSRWSAKRVFYMLATFGIYRFVQKAKQAEPRAPVVLANQGLPENNPVEDHAVTQLLHNLKKGLPLPDAYQSICQTTLQDVKNQYGLESLGEDASLANFLQEDLKSSLCETLKTVPNLTPQVFGQVLSAVAQKQAALWVCQDLILASCKNAPSPFTPSKGSLKHLFKIMEARFPANFAQILNAQNREAIQNELNKEMANIMTILDNLSEVLEQETAGKNKIYEQVSKESGLAREYVESKMPLDRPLVQYYSDLIKSYKDKKIPLESIDNLATVKNKCQQKIDKLLVKRLNAIHKIKTSQISQKLTDRWLNRAITKSGIKSPAEFNYALQLAKKIDVTSFVVGLNPEQKLSGHDLAQLFLSLGGVIDQEVENLRALQDDPKATPEDIEFSKTLNTFDFEDMSVFKSLVLEALIDAKPGLRQALLDIKASSYQQAYKELNDRYLQLPAQASDAEDAAKEASLFRELGFVKRGRDCLFESVQTVLEDHVPSWPEKFVDFDTITAADLRKLQGLAKYGEDLYQNLQGNLAEESKPILRNLVGTFDLNRPAEREYVQSQGQAMATWRNFDTANDPSMSQVKQVLKDALITKANAIHNGQTTVGYTNDMYDSILPDIPQQIYVIDGQEFKYEKNTNLVQARFKEVLPNPQHMRFVTSIMNQLIMFDLTTMSEQRLEVKGQEVRNLPGANKFASRDLLQVGYKLYGKPLSGSYELKMAEDGQTAQIIVKSTMSMVAGAGDFSLIGKVHLEQRIDLNLTGDVPEIVDYNLSQRLGP